MSKEHKNQNSMSFSSAQGGIQVSPQEGHYVNFDVATTYVIPFTVQNVTHEMCTLRFTSPTNQRVFRINTTPVRLAAGLTHVIEAEFFTHVQQDYQDSFVIYTDKGCITVPLVAKCCPNLEFSTKVNFGRVERNRQGLSKVLRFTNRGRREVQVRVNPSPEAAAVVKVSPPSCGVPPLGAAHVYVALQSLDIGHHRWPLQVTVEGEAAQRTVEVEVDVTDCKGTLRDPRTGEELHLLEFFRTYAGTKRTINVDVYNESEQPVSFTFQVAAEYVPSEGVPFDFVPRQGRLGPREVKHVTAIFSPPIVHSSEGWTVCREEQQASNNTYELLFSLLFVETAHTHNVRVTGISTTTVGWLSHPVVDFGQCRMNDHRDAMLKVHNGHENLPLHFVFPRAAHFSIVPAEGKVRPGGTCDVRLTFHPRRLGVFEERLSVVFNKTRDHILALSGVAVSIASKPKIIGGADKLPEDFVRTLKEVQPVKEPRCAIQECAAYTKVDSVDMGMIPAEGLEPPLPELPVATYRTSSTNEFKMIHGVDHLSPITLDAKTLIRKVFREGPNNASERRDCRRELQPMDLLRVVAPVKILDYGRVTVGSRSTKTFFLYNGTSAAVLAEMPREEAHVSFAPLSQVIPGSRAAAFDVTFYCSAVQTYHQVVQLTINGRHMLRFTLQADVVPVEVSLSRDDIVLQFTDFGEDPVAHAPLVLSNHGNSDASYTWVLASGSNHFSILPKSGVIASMSKVTAQVSFDPPHGILSTEARAELHVQGGTSVKVLNLKGVISPALCVWGTVSTTTSRGVTGGGDNEQTVELLQVPSGMTMTTHVVLHNKSRTSAFFSFESIPEWLTIAPMGGRIGEGDSEAIALTVCHETPGLLQSSVLCWVRGMRRPLKLNLTAEISTGEVMVLSPERRDGEALLAFETVCVGTEKALPVHLRNSGDIAAVILVDFRSHMEYSLRCADPEDNGGAEYCSACSGALGGGGKGAASLEWRGRGKSIPGMSYITVSPHSDLVVLFVYRPTVSTENSEHFFVLWRHIGADEKHPLLPLAISARAVSSRVVVSQHLLEFPRTIVRTPAVPLSLTIENTSMEALEWELLPSWDNKQNRSKGGSNGPDTSPFHINPDSGTLAPQASVQVHTTFIPNSEGHPHVKYCLYTDGDRLQPCAEVCVSGFSAQPRIVCDRGELIFSAVPLNVAIRETMYIANDGFDSIEVHYNNTEPGPLTVTFPNGHVLRSSSCIPVCVEFCSSRALSFASSITFTSEKGETLTIPVTGTSVNSFLTTAPYVAHCFKHSEIGPETGSGAEEWTEPLIYREVFKTECRRHSSDTPNAQFKGDRGWNHTLVPDPFFHLDAIVCEMYSQQRMKTLQHWLNSNIFREPVEDLVEALQAADGRILLDALYRLAGKRPPRKAQTMGGTQGKTLTSLESLISFIKSNGGCLSEVRFPYLMTYDMYSHHQRSIGKETVSPEEFVVRANHAWITVVMQGIRVFYLPKVSMTVALRICPLMGAYVPLELWESTPFQTGLHRSNVFSPEECSLLRWVAYNTHKSIENGLLKGVPRSICRFEDLRDCFGMLACIVVYVPSVATRVSLERLVVGPMTQMDMEVNAGLLLSALGYVGVSVHTNTPRELLDYSGVDWLLLSATLFRYLPRLIPIAVITLEGKLLSSMTRSIDVANTSNTSRSYVVEMSNCSFHTPSQELSVDPGDTTQLHVQITLRFNRSIEGDCVLVDTSPTIMEERAPVVFRLLAKSNNDPLRVIHVQTALYTVSSHEIQVENPFLQNCIATLRLAQEYKNDGAYPEGEFCKSIQSAFHLSAGVVPFHNGETTKVVAQFAPCARGRYEARITFYDEHQGEFSYVLIGTCVAPKPTDKCIVRAEAGEECPHTFLLKIQNVPFERTLRLAEDHQRLLLQHTKRTSLMPVLSGIPYNVTFVNEENVGPNPFFRGPETVVFDAGESMLKLNFTFLPKCVGEYAGFILLASKYDVRCIQLTGKCIPTGEKCTLRFACPARQSITQGIPVVNNGNEDWLITATMEGACFSGPRELRVPRGKRREYPLRYNPPWVGVNQGLLVFLNNETGERRTYTLFGEAEEPLSEDVLIVQCKARERCIEMLTVPDINGVDTTYVVETDIPFACGESSLLVRSGATAKYSLVLQPMIGGTYTGSVACRAPNGRFAWYAVTVTVSPPEKEGTVDIKTDARTPMTVDVSIRNPTSKSIKFAVRRFGAGLFGENSVLVDGGADAVYSLLFVPTSVGTFDGKISFCSNEVGEFWYELNIVVEEAAPEEIRFTSEIGVPDVVQVRIPNNTAIDRTLTVSNTNPRNFSTAPAVLNIPAYSELTVDIIYTPTSVDKPQEAMLNFFASSFAEWRYMCRGSGLPPAENAPVNCICEVGGKLSVILKIKNPFEVPMTPIATLLCDDNGYYSLVQEQQQPIPEGVVGSIPLTYSPASVGNHDATVSVRPLLSSDGVQDITWKFPLKGVAEWHCRKAPLRLRCVARRQLEETIKVEAPGLKAEVKNQVSITLDLAHRQQYATAVRTSFQSKVVTDDAVSDALTMHIRFAPMRPFIATSDIVVRSANGAAWRYPVVLEAVRADYDDVLIIKAPLRSASAVTFDMYNAFPKESPFSAYFTPDSSRDLSVTITHGVLCSFIVGHKHPGTATPLQVQFTPSARVPQVEGTLIVDTEEMQWSFKVVGKLESKSTR